MLFAGFLCQDAAQGGHSVAAVSSFYSVITCGSINVCAVCKFTILVHICALTSSEDLQGTANTPVLPGNLSFQQ